MRFEIQIFESFSELSGEARFWLKTSGAAPFAISVGTAIEGFAALDLNFVKSSLFCLSL
jgi:hypothetical protein